MRPGLAAGATERSRVAQRRMLMPLLPRLAVGTRQVVLLRAFTKLGHTVRQPVVYGQVRGFLGGIDEFELERIKARRVRLEQMLVNLNAPLAPDAVQAYQQALAAHAGNTNIGSIQELREAIAEAEHALSKFRTASLALSLDAATSATPEGTAALASMSVDATEPRLEQAMRLPHRLPGADRTETKGASTPSAPEPVSPAAASPVGEAASEDAAQPGGAAAVSEPAPGTAPERMASPLSQEEELTLSSLRLSCALSELPALWTELAQTSVSLTDLKGGGAAAQQLSKSLPVETAASTTLALAEGGLTRTQLWLQLQRLQQPSSVSSDGSPYSAKELDAAVERSVSYSLPLFSLLCERSTMLSTEETEALSRMRLAANADMSVKLLLRELRRVSLWQRLRARFGRVSPAAEAGATEASAAPADVELARMLAEHAAADVRNAKLYASVASEGAFHVELSRAFFAHHDRRQARRRRATNVAKALGLFFSLNVLDVVLSNL